MMIGGTIVRRRSRVPRIFGANRLAAHRPKKPIVNLMVFKDWHFSIGCLLNARIGIVYASAVVIRSLPTGAALHAHLAGLVLIAGGIASCADPHCDCPGGGRANAVCGSVSAFCSGVRAHIRSIIITPDVRLSAPL